MDLPALCPLEYKLLLVSVGMKIHFGKDEIVALPGSSEFNMPDTNELGFLFKTTRNGIWWIDQDISSRYHKYKLEVDLLVSLSLLYSILLAKKYQMPAVCQVQC